MTPDCNHDTAHAEYIRRATWLCPKCGADISIEYVMYRKMIAEDGINRGQFTKGSDRARESGRKGGKARAMPLTPPSRDR